MCVPKHEPFVLYTSFSIRSILQYTGIICINFETFEGYLQELEIALIDGQIDGKTDAMNVYQLCLKVLKMLNVTKTHFHSFPRMARNISRFFCVAL